MGATTLHIRIVVPVQLRRIFLPHGGQYLGLIRSKRPSHSDLFALKGGWIGDSKYNV